MFRNRARAKTKSILFVSLKYTLPHHPHTPKHYSFCAPSFRTGALPHFIIIRSSLLLRPRLRLSPTSLALSLSLLA
jgi:hypothetical protein